MKRIKTFEQMYSDPSVETELGNIPSEGNITPEELQKLCDEALSLDNIDDITKVLVKIRYKYVKDNDDDKIKYIWSTTIFKWHSLFKTMGEPSENLQRKSFEIPSSQRKFNL